MKSEAISRSSMALVAIALLAGTSVGFFLDANQAQQLAQAPKPSTEPIAQQRFKASFSPISQFIFPVVDAGKDRGIWAKHGLDPEWVGFPYVVPAQEYRDLVASGIKIGFGGSSDVLIARAMGIPVKVLAAYTGSPPCWIFVKSDSTSKTMRDLHGKKVGGSNPNDWSYRYITYVSDRFAIKTEVVPLVNLTNNVVALKLGKIDAFISCQATTLRLVDSGELRILLNVREVQPKPWAQMVLFATDDMIESNPDTVRRFVKATLEIVKYLKDNPSYAVDLYMKRTRAPKDLADKAISQSLWTPDGRGGGLDMVTALRNRWQWSVDSGAVPSNVDLKIEDAVDLRFLP